MVQSDVNSLINILDNELSYCIKKLYFLFPSFTRDYYVGIVVAMTRRKLRRYSMLDGVPESCIEFSMNCNTDNPEYFMSMLNNAKMLRGIHYILLGRLATDFEHLRELKFDINESFNLRQKYKANTLPIGELNDILSHFKMIQKIEEAIEKPFYKKVIAQSIAISNRNLDFVQDNFMEGVRGLRKAIWRFDIHNGAILASFIGIWISNAIAEFQAQNNIIDMPSTLSYSYNKLLEEKEKRKANSVVDVAKFVGMSKEKAMDIESAMNREGNIRIDIATQGVEDESSELISENEIEQNFDEGIDDMLNSTNIFNQIALCLSFGLWDNFPKVSLDRKLIEEEMQRQKV